MSRLRSPPPRMLDAGLLMSVLYIAIPVALGIAALALWAFARTVREGQLDDLETPAMRMLHDDDERPRPPGE